MKTIEQIKNDLKYNYNKLTTLDSNDPEFNDKYHYYTGLIEYIENLITPKH